jgi:hypothetical protein
MSEQPQNSSLTQSEPVPDFAPFDVKDGRRLGEWKSKYSVEALKQIRYESIYLVVLLFGSPLVMLLLFLGFPKVWLGVDDVIYKPIVKYGLAWLGGTLGGTLFDLKWLYHSVARRIWHEDRRLWRLLTPHISGGLSFIVIILISSGLLRIFDNKAIESRALVVGIAFLVGYFSDSAVAKLAEIAETLFGSTHSQTPKNSKAMEKDSIEKPAAQNQA